MTRSSFLATLCIAPLVLTAATLAQGRVVAIGDEWILSDHAFSEQPAQTRQLALDIADRFANSGPGHFLVLSDVPDMPGLGARGLLGSSLASTMTQAGHTWTVEPAAQITTANLTQYDGVFCCGTIGSGPTHASVLVDYVVSGGSVLVMGGTGEFAGDATAEANAWNVFLGTVGLAFGTDWLGATPNGTLRIPAQPNGHAIARTLDGVRWCNGQSATVLQPTHPLTQVVLRGDFTEHAGGHAGIIAGFNLGAAPGRIIAIGDDWMLSDHAFAIEPAGSALWVQTIAALFATDGAGDFLALSNVSDDPVLGARGVQGSALATAMTNAGHSWTVDASASITPTNLRRYDGVFLCGTAGSGPAPAATLIDYVRNGGSVLVMGGTGAFGSAYAEANAWAPLLNAFGLGFGDTFFAGAGDGMLTVPTLVSGNVVGRDLTQIPWLQGQLAIDYTDDPINHVALRGDFGARPGPQGAYNDVIATYNAGSIAAAYGSWGGGCAGSAGIPTNTSLDLPVLGKTMRVQLDNIPAPGATFFSLGLRRFAPIDLAPIGAAGCVVRVGTDAGQALFGVGTVTYELGLPRLQDCLGMSLFTQGFVLDSSANTLGVILSDAAVATIGN